ncbi:MAG TPA: hypothetical protein VLE02_01735 [Nitrosarchaeum sp.]|nr:hypothetical protein [Nitrosarchaeum sp.]
MSKNFERGDAEDFKQKMNALLKFITDNTYDVVCIQDFPLESHINDSFLRSVRESKYGRVVPKNSSKKFGNAMFCPQRCEEYKYVPFHRDEDILIAKLVECPIIFSSVKFSDSVKIIRNQIKNFDKHFKSDDKVVVCCDSNIKNHHIIKNISEEWKDAWKEFGLSCEEFTDGDERPDRIYCKGITDGTFHTIDIPSFERKAIEFTF